MQKKMEEVQTPHKYSHGQIYPYTNHRHKKQPATYNTQKNDEEDTKNVQVNKDNNKKRKRKEKKTGNIITHTHKKRIQKNSQISKMELP